MAEEEKWRVRETRKVEKGREKSEKRRRRK